MLVYIAALLVCWVISSVKSKSIKIIKANKSDIENKMLKCKTSHKRKLLNINNKFSHQGW